MADWKTKQAQFQATLRKHFSKLILLFVVLGASAMLRARLAEVHNSTPTPPPIAKLTPKLNSEIVAPDLLLDPDELDEDESSITEIAVSSDVVPVVTTRVPPTALIDSETLSDSVPVVEVSAAAQKRFMSAEQEKPARVAQRSIRAALKEKASTLTHSSEPSLSSDSNWKTGLKDDAQDLPPALLEYIQNTLSEVALLGSYDREHLQSMLQIDQIDSALAPVVAVLNDVPRLHFAVGVIRKNRLDSERAALVQLAEGLDSNSPGELPKSQPLQENGVQSRSGDPEPHVMTAAAPVSIATLPQPNQPRILDARKELANTEAHPLANLLDGAEQTMVAEGPDIGLRMAEGGQLPADEIALAPLSPASSESENVVSDVSPQPIVASRNILSPGVPSTSIPVSDRRVVSSHPGESSPQLLVNHVDSPRLETPAETTRETPVELSRVAQNKEAPPAVLDPVDDHIDEMVGDKRVSHSPISGVLEVAEDAALWLDDKKGHIELYMLAKDSHDPEDTIFLSYSFPDTDFEIDGRALHRNYRLLAGVYLPDSPAAYATVEYNRLIGPAARDRIRFVINKAAILKSASTKKRTGYLPLTISVYEGLPGNYRQPVPIAGASLQVVGFEGLGTVKTASDGSIKLPAVPVHSELLVRLSAPNFLPTERVIPVFETPAYVPIYLLPQGKVEDISRYFGQDQQRPDKSVLIGRVFDPIERIPKAFERFRLSFRKSGPLYFGSLPDPSLRETTNQGLFGFFNVSPSFRVLSKEQNNYGVLNQFRPGYGYYFEWGRGGAKPIRGRVEDPFSPRPLHAKIAWLENKDKAIDTDLTNRFEFKGVDLPAGVVTLEADALGYPKTWHTIPWSTRERADERVLHMVESDLVRESGKSFARTPTRAGLGAIIGGAAPGFFGRGECVNVSLKSVDLGAVPLVKGPYYFSKKRYDKTPFCLTVKEPGFSYVNLEPGDYILQFNSSQKTLLRTRFIRVGSDRLSVAVQ